MFFKMAIIVITVILVMIIMVILFVEILHTTKAVNKKRQKELKCKQTNIKTKRKYKRDNNGIYHI